MKPLNKTAIKIYKISTLFFLFVMLCADCAITPKLKSHIYHDKINPCANGEYFNSNECDNWKKLYPKEYKRYEERMKNSIE